MRYAVLPYCPDEAIDDLTKFAKERKHIYFDGRLFLVDDEISAVLLVEALYDYFGNFCNMQIICGEFTDASFGRFYTKTFKK